MKYPQMKFFKILSELNSEEKARAWIWLAKFDGKKFVCPQCNNETCWQHHKNPEVRECKKCHFEVRLRANTIFQHSKTSLLIWLRAICLVTQGKRGISALELQKATKTHKDVFLKEETWFDRELAGCTFKDVRLGKRFQKLLKQLSDGIGESIPLVCQDWANTKAAYRFFFE